MTTTLPAQLVGGAKIKANVDVELVNRLGAALNDMVSAKVFASTDGVLDDSDVQIAVVAKRLKYRQPIYQADSWHFHHRMANIGFSQRRTVAYLYAWTLVMAGLALALRFVPYSDNHGHFDLLWTVVMGVCLFVALASSVYLVYVLEILKLRRGRINPETGEFEAIELEPPAGDPS